MSRYLGNALRAEIFADTWEWRKGDHWLVFLSGGWILLVSWHWVSFFNVVDNCEGWLIFSLWGSFPNTVFALEDATKYKSWYRFLAQHPAMGEDIGEDVR